jgi:hypothetical protein
MSLIFKDFSASLNSMTSLDCELSTRRRVFETIVLAWFSLPKSSDCCMIESETKMNEEGVNRDFMSERC